MRSSAGPASARARAARAAVAAVHCSAASRPWALAQYSAWSARSMSVVGVAGGREVADPDRGRDRQAVGERPRGHRRAHALGGGERLGRGGVGQQPGELLAADPADGVDRARLARDPRGGLGEHAVADRMAVLVVDGLEVVEVDDDEAERAAARGEAVGLLAQALGERALVEQARQAVAVGGADELGLAGGLGRAVVDGDERRGLAAG